MQCGFRNATREDLQKICDLSHSMFLDRDPWTLEDFQFAMDNGLFLTIAYNATDSEEFVAFMCYMFVLEEAKLLMIWVAPYMQRKGLARAMVKAFARHANENGVRFLMLHVRVSNAPAIRLYRKFGFTTVSTRHLYYKQNPEDAYLMECDLNRLPEGVLAEIQKV